MLDTIAEFEIISNSGQIADKARGKQMLKSLLKMSITFCIINEWIIMLTGFCKDLKPEKAATTGLSGAGKRTGPSGGMKIVAGMNGKTWAIC